MKREVPPEAVDVSLVADIGKRSLNIKSEKISHVPREKNSELKSSTVTDFQTNQTRPMPSFLADLQGTTYGDKGACPLPNRYTDSRGCVRSGFWHEPEYACIPV